MIVKELTKSYQQPRFAGKILALVAPNSTGESRRAPPLHMTWSKLAYATWIEGVKKTFKEGDLVCSKTIPPIQSPSKAFPFYYVITMIQEIHHLCETDKKTGIPKAIGMVIPGTNIPTWRTPDELRHLTFIERANVNLRAKEEETVFPDPESASPIHTTE